MKTKVENMTNSNGNKVAHQFKIYTPTAVYFQSYDTIIAKIERGKVYIDSRKWNCSKTTSRYRNQFLEENQTATQRKIDSGEYILTDLNESPTTPETV